MTPEQELAGTQLLRALNKCHRVGLAGGVYDRCFAIWPHESSIDLVDGHFFEDVDEYGRVLPTHMSLDGSQGEQ
jgi:hypothetical protein